MLWLNLEVLLIVSPTGSIPERLHTVFDSKMATKMI